jgi:hypothetical protein
LVVQFTGDSRVNEQPMLTALHTIMLREHNRIAKSLSQLNSHWTDEKVFQEARRLVIAEVQHITYTHWLPALLGEILLIITFIQHLSLFIY